ncbi:MAG: hypothetical protein FJ112_01240 [Deltaproteobacteria bacterium]|nr:hypothetical protein [Deltaproteobacteria bacterium]
MNTHLQFKKSENVGKQVNAEYILVSLDSGKFFHFTPSTENFLNFFSSPRSIDEFLTASKINQDKTETDYIKNFCSYLLDEKILSSNNSVSLPSKTETPLKYRRPELIREGDNVLSDFKYCST